MKKLAIFAAALMLTLGLAQCKKEQPLTPETEAKIIHITVNVGGGSKHVVVPGEGTVTFADGDVLYVGDGSHYIGTLTCADGAFSGDIYEPAGENPQMHLYFAGGLTPSATPVQGTTENFTVNLSNQSSKLPVLSYTSVAYTGPGTYSCLLENKCALVKFSLSSSTSERVTLGGVYNTATIDFANGAITPVETTGNVTLYPDPNNQLYRWGILLEQTSANATAMIGGNTYSITGFPAITNNYYNGNTPSGVSINFWNPIFDSHTSALTFEAKTAGVQITIKPKAGAMEYVTNNSNNWERVYSTKTITLSSVGDKVSFRVPSGSGPYESKSASFSSSGGEFYVYGNIMSLNYYDYANATSLGSGGNWFEGLFENNTGLYSHPEKALLLPATSLNKNCYASMFKGCTSLTTAPELPATSLATGCYQSMFEGCTNLVSVPASLPVTSLPAVCYQSMFKGCTALTTAPELPATSLQQSCYLSMFEGCTNLVSVPARLPATSMQWQCYKSMFKGCTSLTTAPELPATSLEESCYESMFEGCTALTTAPELPATLLTGYRCYGNMFSGCSRLSSITCLATARDNNYDEHTEGWVNGVAATGTFNKSFYHWGTGGSGIPSGWTKNLPSLATLSSDYEAENGEELWGTLGTGVQISIADGATITLRSANINGSDDLSGTFHGLKCLGDATIILKNNDNVVKAKCSSGGRAGIFVPQHKTLTFEAGNSSGFVAATGAGEAAGIGGYSNTNCGAIVINSGKVTGTAGSGVDELWEDSYSAGIGSSAYKRCDGITINGGQVIGTAYADGNAAGIGTGGNGICKKDGDSDGSQPAITISNTLSNYVKAQKGSSATYFIGGGTSSKCGIVIVGGTTYEDGGGNRGISSSTSLSYDFTVTGNTLIYMP